jgi:hypothetical protein
MENPEGSPFLPIDQKKLLTGLKDLRANGNRVLIPFVLRYRNTTLVFLANDKRSR